MVGFVASVVFFFLLISSCHPSHRLPWGAVPLLLLAVISGVLGWRSGDEGTKAFWHAASATAVVAGVAFLCTSFLFTNATCGSSA
jgi:hypothetical protein